MRVVDYKSIMSGLTEYTAGRKLVLTMDVDSQASTESHTVFYLKETY